MSEIRFLHLAGTEEEYRMDWTDWLAGDRILSSHWYAIGHASLSHATQMDAVTSVWVTAGTVGEEVELVNHVTTAAGRNSAHAHERQPPRMYLLVRAP